MRTFVKFSDHASFSQVPGLAGWFDNVDALARTESMGDPRSGLGVSFARSQDAFSRVLMKKAMDGTPLRHVKVRYDSDEGLSTVVLESVLVTAVSLATCQDGCSEQVTLDASQWWVE